MKVLISCGEPSGDLYAGALTRELNALDPSIRVFGLGGDHLRAAGGEVVEDFRGLTVTGLSEAVSVLPRSLATFRRLVALTRREQPDVFVPIDFPDFNFRLAGSVSGMHIPVVYYVCPQVWAWRRGRLRTIKRFATRVLVIFPFEEKIYDFTESDYPHRPVAALRRHQPIDSVATARKLATKHRFRCRSKGRISVGCN